MKVSVWVQVANAAGVTWSAGRTRKIMRTIAAFLFRGQLVGLIMVSEANDFLIRNLVDTKVWQVVQLGEKGSDGSWVAMVARRKKVRLSHPRLYPGSPATSEGGNINPRPILVCDMAVYSRRKKCWVDVGPVASVHNPPGRAQQAQKVFMANLRALCIQLGIVLAGGDMNGTARQILGWLGRKLRHVGVLALTAPRETEHGVDVRLGQAFGRNVRSDHPGLFVRATFVLTEAYARRFDTRAAVARPTPEETP